MAKPPRSSEVDALDGYPVIHGIPANMMPAKTKRIITFVLVLLLAGVVGNVLFNRKKK
jgi:hypothetical protein